MLFLAPADLRGVTSTALEGLLERRDLAVAFGKKRTSGWRNGHGIAALWH